MHETLIGESRQLEPGSLSQLSRGLLDARCSRELRRRLPSARPSVVELLLARRGCEGESPHCHLFAACVGLGLKCLKQAQHLRKMADSDDHHCLRDRLEKDALWPVADDQHIWRAFHFL